MRRTNQQKLLAESKIRQCVKEVVDEKLPELEKEVSKRILESCLRRSDKLDRDDKNADEHAPHRMFDPLAGP